MKLWQSKANMRKDVEQFTVGNDCILDLKLLQYDAKASMAHAAMLKVIGVLTAAEEKKLQKELQNISVLAAKGKFKITSADEDCHTAIENHLTKKLGNVGKKIHTVRSRNDQVAVALRLYMLDYMEKLTAAVKQLHEVIVATAKKNAHIPLPGYTHMQKAMPSSAEKWLGAFAAALDDDLTLLAAVKKILNQNPLGTGAGYGLPMAAGRKTTTKLLGFAKEQHVTYVQNSRGKFELLMLQSLQQLMLDLSKLATDILLFSTAEFSFVALPPTFLTGSSIMPQKNNYDVMELVRGRYGLVSGCATTIATISANLPSGYNRDMQLTKEPLMKGTETTLETLIIMAAAVNNLSFNEKCCRAAMTKGLYATEEAYRLVRKGMPFRDAYQQVKKGLPLKVSHT